MDIDDWQQRAHAHAARLAPYATPHLARRKRRIKHPVHDFLFQYYNYRPAQLLTYHPGAGVRLTPAPRELRRLKGYVEVGGTLVVSPEFVRAQRPLIQSTRRLLAATAARPAHTGCFGMHEWAMVYRQSEDETRHSQHPLRLGADATADVVDTNRIACTHFDAFRFFTEAARPLNTLQPGHDDRSEFEQPGCLHAGMDLYKHAFRLTPMVASDLIADAFELAWEIRILDMRAAPYDMTGTVLDPGGEQWTPVRVETPEGKQAYVDAQKRFAKRAGPLRQRLIDECDRLLAADHSLVGASETETWSR